jgi:CRISPR system Cascade subunit CasC
MNRFLQIHALTPYAPSNLNRDEMGKPKSALFGGAKRLRISSQCLKRTWRTSDVFQNELRGNIGVRTKHIGDEILNKLLLGGVEEERAKTIATEVSEKLGKL